MSTKNEVKEQLKNDELKLDAILSYFKLLYIEYLTCNKSISGFKLLYGDCLLEKVFDDDQKRVISLNSTNYMLAQDLQIYVSKALENDKKICGMYGDLEWVNEIVSIIPADEKAIETIASFLPYELYAEVLKEHNRLPMPKERIMQKRISEVCKIIKTKENS
jgi:hypothetical protein